MNTCLCESYPENSVDLNFTECTISCGCLQTHLTILLWGDGIWADGLLYAGKSKRTVVGVNDFMGME